MKNSQTLPSTPTTGPSASETPSTVTTDPSLKKMKDSDLFNFDPATITDAHFDEIVARLRPIVAKMRKARNLQEVADAVAAEEEAKKKAKKAKKKPISERTLT